MNWMSKEGFKRFFGMKPIKIGLVGYPGIGKTVYLTILYGLCAVLRKCEKMTLMAGKSQHYFQSKWNQLTGVERQFLQGTEQATQFDFKMTLTPQHAFRFQSQRIEFVDPPGEALTVNPQADANEVKKVDAFLNEVDALLVMIEPDDFDFVALGVKLKALLERIIQDQRAFEQDKKAFVIQQCDQLQIKLLPEQGSASLTSMIAMLSDMIGSYEDNRAVETLLALYKQDAQDRAVAHLNRIGERLDRPLSLAVVVTKADKLLPFQDSRPRPTVLIPDQLREYKHIKADEVDKLVRALSQYWGNRDDRWPPIIQQLFDLYAHFFNDLSRVKGDYQIFFVSAMGDVDWDQTQQKTRPPRTIRPLGIENPITWCLRQIKPHHFNRLGLGKHFVILLILALMIWPIQRFNHEIGPRLEKTETLNAPAYWKNQEWWAIGNREVARRYELLQMQAYWETFNNWQQDLEDEEKMIAKLNALNTAINVLDITDDRTYHTQKILQRLIYETKIGLKVKSDYNQLRNTLVPEFHYQVDCCLSENKACQETLRLSQQVSLRALQKRVKTIRNNIPPRPRSKALLCFKKQLDYAAGQMRLWYKKGKWLTFEHGEMPSLNQRDKKMVILFGSNEIEKGEGFRWFPNHERNFKFLMLDSQDNIIKQAVYQDPYEFVNNICWNEEMNLTVRPFFEIYLQELTALFPPIDPNQNHCGL
jgi:hypothetical protein